MIKRVARSRPFLVCACVLSLMFGYALLILWNMFAYQADCKALIESGADLIYQSDTYDPNNHFWIGGPRPGPDFLKEHLGERFFDRVIGVYRFGSKFGADELTIISKMVDMTHLNLGGMKIDDEQMQFLANLRQLEELSLTDTRIGDAGIEKIKHCRKLQRLDLSETLITDASMKYLANMKDLSELNLSNTLVSPEGMKSLESLTHLRKLWLNRTALCDEVMPSIVCHKSLEQLEFCWDTSREAFDAEPDDIAGPTPASIARLKELKQLKSLRADSKKIDDRCLHEISGLENLDFLTVMGAKVTDEGLADLAKLIRLKLLDVRYTKVTKEGVRKLRAETNDRLYILFD